MWIIVNCADISLIVIGSITEREYKSHENLLNYYMMVNNNAVSQKAENEEYSIFENS